MYNQIKNERKTKDEITNAREFVLVIQKILTHELDFTFDQSKKIVDSIINEYNEQ